MPTAETLRHVPWTCRWGRFGEPVPPPPPVAGACFVFWTCAHPQVENCQLTRDSCERCGHWHPTSVLQIEDPL
jgi:hypothetical protein